MATGLLECLREHGFRPAVFDLRDAGESTHPRAAYGAEELAGDAAAVLDALDWPAAHVFGLSLGGVVAQRLALRHPDRVLTVTSFASGPSDAGVARWHGPPLRELRKPVLVMCGDADPVMRPRASRDTAAAISGARLVILPGVGHSLPRAVWPTVAREMRTLAHP